MPLHAKSLTRLQLLVATQTRERWVNISQAENPYRRRCDTPIATIRQNCPCKDLRLGPSVHPARPEPKRRELQRRAAFASSSRMDRVPTLRHICMATDMAKKGVS